MARRFAVSPPSAGLVQMAFRAEDRGAVHQLRAWIPWLRFLALRPERANWPDAVTSFRS